MNRYQFLFVVVLVIFCGCATSNIYCWPNSRAADKEDFELVIEENYPDKRFEIHLYSNTDKTLCFHNDYWPNSDGALHFASEYVYVTVNDRKFYIADTNFGQCIPMEKWQCVQVLPPGGVISAYISFFEFDEQMYSDPDAERYLTYDIWPDICW